VTEPQQNTWQLWAHRYDSGILFNVGPRPYVELHQLPHPIVPVQVTIVDAGSPEATHWGWLWTEDDGQPGRHRNWCGGAPELIQPHQGLYSMQFTYGPRPEEERGRGRTVRLKITITTTEGEDDDG
jgi:hypothetical protein